MKKVKTLDIIAGLTIIAGGITGFVDGQDGVIDNFQLITRILVIPGLYIGFQLEKYYKSLDGPKENHRQLC